MVRRSGLRSFFRDMFVVVASILIAFGLDAWGGWYGDRQEQRQKLLGLRAEFSSVTANLKRQAGLHARVVAAVDSVLIMTGPVTTSTERLHTQRPLSIALIPATLDVSSGHLNALLAGGRLELIRNPELRSALAAWDGVLRDATEDEADARAHLLRDVIPLLADASQLRAHFQLGTISRAESGFELTYRALLADPRVASALDFRASWLRHVIEELNGVEVEARRIVAMVDSELRE